MSATDQTAQESQVALLNETLSKLGSKLVEVQKNSKAPTLARTRPAEWLEIASKLAQGQSKTSLRTGKGGKWDRLTIERVIAELDSTEGIDELKKKWAIESATNVNLLRSAIAKGVAKINDMLDDGGSLEPKEIKELAVAYQIEANVHQRLRGEADTVIKYEGATPEDVKTLADEIRARRLKKAEVIELEEVE